MVTESIWQTAKMKSFHVIVLSLKVSLLRKFCQAVSEVSLALRGHAGPQGSPCIPKATLFLQEAWLWQLCNEVFIGCGQKGGPASRQAS